MRLREARAEHLAYDEAKAALQAGGVCVLEEVSWRRHLSYLTDSHGDPISEETHRNCPGHGAFLRLDWEHDDSAEHEEENYRARGYSCKRTNFEGWMSFVLVTGPNRPGPDLSVASP